MSDADQKECSTYTGNHPEGLSAEIALDSPSGLDSKGFARRVHETAEPTSSSLQASQAAPAAGQQTEAAGRAADSSLRQTILDALNSYMDRCSPLSRSRP